jgi:hypothetical protein
MHNITKLLGRILANRLVPHLDQLILHGQSAFIKGRSIHDNFQYIQGAIRHFHFFKTPMSFIKLGIAKAFDSILWEFMLEVMEHLGFRQRWRDLLCLIWSSKSSPILLNGEAGSPIKHNMGLRQGDPLSPLVFILAIDLLQRVLDTATQQGLLHPINVDLVRTQTSLYVDDTVLFVRPIASDIANL